MLPLVAGTMEAKKLLIFSGERTLGKTIHPSLGVELHNTTGMKLPAGPVTVYDGGAYAGDALIEFFSHGEKRLISYGEDLSVTGSAAESGSRLISAVNISGGLMTISRKQTQVKTYTLKNASGENREILIEHPITFGTGLVEPANPGEQTASVYRFSLTLPAREELTFSVEEERPILERISLIQQRPETFLTYTSSEEIPGPVRAALQRALELKREADAAEKDLGNLRSHRDFLASEQDRVRLNLEAAGSQTQQGQEYLRRMALLDGDLDKNNAALDEAQKKAREAQKTYEAYLGSLNL
jgi:hypothetical protein